MAKLRKSAHEKQDVLFQALIDKNMRLYGFEKMKDVADILGIDRRTFGYKYACPDKFTRAELRRLCQVLKFSPEERSCIL